VDITQAVAELKARPGFAEQVGMILIHNGVVRGWSRADRQPVTAVTVTPDREKIEALRREYEQRPGIYAVLIEARAGLLKPGDDLLFIVVAGDIREHVKPVLSELLERVKAEAVVKSEIRA
jgi:molybdopterin synthase catalytic subunit